VGFVLLERSDLNGKIAELSRVQALGISARELSLYVQYNAHDTNAYTLGHVEHRQEYVAHAEQFRRELDEVERGLAEGAVDRKTEQALQPIGPTRERYERASLRLFRAADQNRGAPTRKNQQREDAAWEKADTLGDELDQLSQALAGAIAAKARGLQDDVDRQNQQIMSIVLVLALLVGVLVMLIQSAATRARAGAESARRRSEELRSRNQSILNAAGDGIYGLDAEGRTTFVNPAAAWMTDHAVEELLGRRWQELVHHSRPDGSPYPVGECPAFEAVGSGTFHRSDHDVYWRKDGTSFPVEYTSTPLLERGEVKGAVVVFKDITERREVERAKDEFTSVVSHELRTPLTSIRGSLGLLESGVLGPLSEKGQRMVEIAVQNTDRLVRLINDILDIEHINAGTVAMHPKPCDAAELVESAIQSVEALAAEAQVRLLAETEPAELHADPDRVLQTLTNLISNALKFSPAGTSVRVSSVRREGEVLFEVADQGRGIPPDKLETIFGRFQQVDASDSREKGGTGLGLAICRTIVEHHGGRIWVKSEPGQGSTFSFALPAEQTNGSAPRDREQ
jgi:PAS domain S-box-containing protein